MQKLKKIQKCNLRTYGIPYQNSYQLISNLALGYDIHMEYGNSILHTHHQYGKYGIYSIFQFDTRSKNSNLIIDLSYVYPYRILLYSAITTLIATY